MQRRPHAAQDSRSMRRIRNRLIHWHARASRDLALLTDDPAALDALFELSARIERDLVRAESAKASA